jgi:hypothetical protein
MRKQFISTKITVTINQKPDKKTIADEPIKMSRKKILVIHVTYCIAFNHYFYIYTLKC